MVVWRFVDGKKGHETQSLGLVQALQDRTKAVVHVVPVARGTSGIGAFLRRRFDAAASLPDPDLIVGAGHATHWPMLSARRARGGLIVALMKPSLPLRLFDLCLVPEHDGVAVAASNVFRTRGVLTRMRPCAAPRGGAGVILVGGPSNHHAWDTPSLIEQVHGVLARDQARRWTITTSRRTPRDTVDAFMALDAMNADIVVFDRVDDEWLPAQLERAPSAWVTEDSVSMVYEALTAGCATGLLRVPETQCSRVSLGLAKLVRGGLATTYAQWCRGHPLCPPSPPFDEAQRCARWMVEEWLPGR